MRPRMSSPGLVGITYVFYYLLCVSVLCCYSLVFLYPETGQKKKILEKDRISGRVKGTRKLRKNVFQPLIVIDNSVRLDSASFVGVGLASTSGRVAQARADKSTIPPIPKARY